MGCWSRLHHTDQSSLLRRVGVGPRGLSLCLSQAHEASLAFLKAPSLDEEFGEAAAIAFSRLAWGKPLQARVHAKVSILSGDRMEVHGPHVGLLNSRVRSCRLLRTGPRCS